MIRKTDFNQPWDVLISATLLDRAFEHHRDYHLKILVWTESSAFNAAIKIKNILNSSFFSPLQHVISIRASPSFSHISTRIITHTALGVIEVLHHFVLFCNWIQSWKKLNSFSGPIACFESFTVSKGLQLTHLSL